MHLLSTTASCPPELAQALQAARGVTEALQPCRQLSFEDGRGVTLSRCKSSGRMVVVKCQSREDSAELQQVLTEVAVHSALTPSPHICPLLAAAQDSRQVVLVLEHAEGGTLRDHMEALMSEEKLRDWVARPLLHALEVLQAQGVVHRDVKPENVLVHDGQLLLADFGLAATVTPDPASSASNSRHSSPRCSSDGSIAASCSSGSEALPSPSGSAAAAPAQCGSLAACGTPMYTAPEVLLAMFRSQALRPVVTPKNDVWSLGLMLLEALTGNHPFSEQACAASGGNVMYNVAYHKAVALPDSVGPQFKDFLGQMLQRDPERRPTARQLLSHPWLHGGEAPRSLAPRLRPRCASGSGLPDGLAEVDAQGSGVAVAGVARSISNGAFLARIDAARLAEEAAHDLSSKAGAVASNHYAVTTPTLNKARGELDLVHALSYPSIIPVLESSPNSRSPLGAKAPVARLPQLPEVPAAQSTAFEMALCWED